MDILTVTPMISIRPNRISCTQLVRRIRTGNFASADAGSEQPRPAVASQPRAVPVQKPKLVKMFHNFEISKNSARNLKDKIQYLFQFAKSRKIKTYNGKVIPNFKICFLTLTLPAPQVHNTAEITKDCLDAFLQVLRQRLSLKNYVWRMEFQANGNVHYHIATDVYIDYYFARKHWNAILETKGYVSAFAEKMMKLNYTDYARRFNPTGQTSPDVLYKRYVRGRAEKWRNPNTVDVKNAKSSDNIASYISKYFSKKEKKASKNPLDNEDNSFALRLCFWSRSLSKCKAESMPADYYAPDLVYYFERDASVLRCVFDYCRVYYYAFNQINVGLRAWLGEYFRLFMRSIEYEPAT